MGQSLAVDDVTPEAAAERLRAAGVPDLFVDAALEGQRTVRDGKAAATADTVARVLGRRPRSFARWVRDHAALFR